MDSNYITKELHEKTNAICNLFQDLNRTEEIILDLERRIEELKVEKVCYEDRHRALQLDLKQIYGGEKPC